MAKFQVPTMGGLRKVIKPGISTPGTTIAEVGSGTITLTQLAAAINNILQGSGTITTSQSSAYLQVGPGLSGGGVLTGIVPLRLTAPIPALLAEDGIDGDIGPPGIPGPRGLQGIPGQFLLPEDGTDGDWGPPGAAGAIGATGTTGPQGPPGPSGTGSSGGAGTLMMMLQDDAHTEDLLYHNVPSLGGVVAADQLTLRGTINILSTLVLGNTVTSQATLLFPGATPAIIATATAAILQILTNASGLIQMGVNNNQNLLIDSNGNTTVSHTISGAAQLQVISNGSVTAILSQGGNSSGNANMIWQNAAGTQQFMKLFGDGGLVLDSSSGGGATALDKGFGTINVKNDLYINNVPIAANAKQAAAGAAPFFIVDDSYTDDGIGPGGIPNTVGPLNVNGAMTVNGGGGFAFPVSLNIGSVPATASIAVQGAPNANTFFMQASTASGQSFGILLRAGTTAGDFTIAARNATAAVTFFEIFGDGHGVLGASATNGAQWTSAGNFTFTSSVGVQGATPAVTAAQTDIGITTTATVITTAGGIALPALASTFWVVNVNGVKYGVPCFAL